MFLMEHAWREILDFLRLNLPLKHAYDRQMEKYPCVLWLPGFKLFLNNPVIFNKNIYNIY